jgi:hypothetical protein
MYFFFRGVWRTLALFYQKIGALNLYIGRL